MGGRAYFEWIVSGNERFCRHVETPGVPPTAWGALACAGSHRRTGGGAPARTVLVCTRYPRGYVSEMLRICVVSRVF